MKRGWAGALIGVLLALAPACGTQTPQADQPAASTTPAISASPTVNADGNGVLVPKLPDLSKFPLPSKQADRRIFGADISWPQCPKGMGIPQKRSEGLPMPPTTDAFVVIGLTNGPSFVANPCIAAQVAWVRSRHLLGAAYTVVSFPDARTLADLGGEGPFTGGGRLEALRNVGHQAAVFNIATMKRVGLRTPIVWIDVEQVPHFEWTNDTEANAAVVQGAARGYVDAGYRIGLYSTPALWRQVVGGLRFGQPEWRAAGQTSMAEALSRCGRDWSFQGGAGTFGQWVEAHRDRNVTCPGTATDMRRWFHQY